jgi:hypothetical protein
MIGTVASTTRLRSSPLAERPEFGGVSCGLTTFSRQSERYLSIPETPSLIEHWSRALVNRPAKTMNLYVGADISKGYADY